MEDEVDGLTGRLWILFKTITSEYDRERPAAGAAPGNTGAWRSVANGTGGIMCAAHFSDEHQTQLGLQRRHDLRDKEAKSPLLHIRR
jgi:hypothetical protein